jgi:hypothetical protein
MFVEYLDPKFITASRFPRQDISDYYRQTCQSSLAHGLYVLKVPSTRRSTSLEEACCAAVKVHDNNVIILAISTPTKHRRQGMGKVLVDYIQKETKMTVKADSILGALPFWTSLGFTQRKITRGETSYVHVNDIEGCVHLERVLI